MPRISVLLPARDAGEFLDPALASVVGQSCGDFELIAIDDGSTDGTGERLDRWAERDGRIRVIRQEGRGIVAALNRALDEARGELIARMDCDDIALPERFARQTRALDDDPATVALGGAVLMVDPEDLPIAEIFPPSTHEGIVAKLAQGRGAAIVHPTLMARTEALRAAGGYREPYRHIEDLDLYWRLKELGRLGNLPVMTLRYRQHPGSANMRYARLQEERVARWLREVAGIEAPASRFYRPASKAQLYADWSARALGAGHRRTCRKYALRSLALRPAKVSVWRILLTQWRKREN